MKIVFCAAEVAPFSQAGGLGDVIGSLPRALAELGLEVMVITPRYGLIDPHEHALKPLDIQFPLTVWNQTFDIGVSTAMLPGSQVPVYFLESLPLFGSRQEVYPYGNLEFETRSFLTLCEAVFTLLPQLEFQPDILHGHDWHTANAAVGLAARRYHGDAFYANTRSVLSIHNLQYQGILGHTNRLHEGIVHADWLTTVSPTYAREIQTPEFGAGLDGLIASRRDRLSGILNGIDTRLYNPEEDLFLPARYTAETADNGKTACKEALQMELGLPVDPNVPVIGFVGRLTEQKGLDILIPAIRRLVESGVQVQLAILGSGDPYYQEAIRDLHHHYPHVRNYIGFNLALAHKVYAGSDLFVMPSRFEPCGLGQLIALRYGTIPVVRGVGGLVDTVTDSRGNPESGNGFVFGDYSVEALVDALQAALHCYDTDKSRWAAIRSRGMREDHSWQSSAREYQTLYTHLIR